MAYEALHLETPKKNVPGSCEPSTALHSQQLPEMSSYNNILVDGTKPPYKLCPPSHFQFPEHAPEVHTRPHAQSKTLSTTAAQLQTFRAQRYYTLQRHPHSVSTRMPRESESCEFLLSATRVQGCLPAATSSAYWLFKKTRTKKNCVGTKRQIDATAPTKTPKPHNED